MDWEIITRELRKPLDAAAVRKPAPGKFGEYVDGKHVIDEANRIFGHDGWSYEVTRLQQVSEQTVQGRNGEQYRVGYLCGVRVNVGGVVREGLAVGSGNGKPDSMADHHESAVKEAETDALKRALRSFGNTFGLALYEKDKSKRDVAEVIPQDVLDAVRGAVDLPSLQAVWSANKNWQLHPEFKEAKDQRKSELSQEAA